MATPTLLSLSDVGKTFIGDSGSTDVLAGVSWEGESGEVVVLRGPNGCGKSTLLNLIAGLDAPTQGRICVGPSVSRSHVGYVFQNYASSLLPWLTLRDNILLPLRLVGLSTSERQARMRELSEYYRLSEVPLDRFPSEASGGQKQRACIARAVLSPGPVLLMDEPVSSLDEDGRQDLLSLVEYVRSCGDRIVVMVLHDLDDALLFADRLLVLRGRPATVARDVAVTLPRPRSSPSRLTPEFSRLRQVALGTDR